MSDVQLENGYTRIADEILEQMARIKLSPTQYRLLFIIWRYTYGFNRKEHDLTLGFFEKAIGCDKRQIQRELKGLEERKIIFQNVINGKGRKIKFNKNYNEWVGKSAIGETTIGEIVNGETVKGTIGETVKGTIGETVNQDKQYIKTNIKTEYTSDFEAFWKEYPRKVSKQVAFKRWKKLMKEKVSFDLLMNCTRNYARAMRDRKTSPEFILHPSTFLNDERYLDYENYSLPFRPTEKKAPHLELVNLTQEELIHLERAYASQRRNAAAR